MRLIRVRRGLEVRNHATSSLAQRMIQFDLALLISSRLVEDEGHTWCNGTALYLRDHLH